MVLSISFYVTPTKASTCESLGSLAVQLSDRRRLLYFFGATDLTCFSVDLFIPLASSSLYICSPQRTVIIVSSRGSIFPHNVFVSLTCNGYLVHIFGNIEVFLWDIFLELRHHYGIQFGINVRSAIECFWLHRFTMTKKI